jgi:hypothetical protein
MTGDVAVAPERSCSMSVSPRLLVTAYDIACAAAPPEDRRNTPLIMKATAIAVNVIGKAEPDGTFDDRLLRVLRNCLAEFWPVVKYGRDA